MRDDRGAGQRKPTWLQAVCVAFGRWLDRWLGADVVPELAINYDAVIARLGVRPICGGVDTEVASGDATAVQRWAARIWIESSREIYFAKFIKDRDPNGFIERKEELDKQPGEKITFSLGRKLSGGGVQNDAVMEGNEESLLVYSDSLTLFQQRNAVRLVGRMSEKRTAYDQRTLAKTQLMTWLAEFLDDNIFTNLDNSPTTVIFPVPSYTSVSNILAGDLFTPALIDRAVAKAKKSIPKLYPVKLDGRELYVVIVHTDVGYDIKTGGNTGTWQTVQQYAGVRDLLNNRIFSGALGYWGGAVIHEHEKVPIANNWGAGNNINGASNMFLARQAGILAFGARPEAWEKEFDYGAKTGFCIGAIWAFKKAVFNGVDHGYAAIRTSRTST